MRKATLCVSRTPAGYACGPGENFLLVGSSNFTDIMPNKKGPKNQVPFYLVRPERFELPTTWFVARYSIQLSYGRKIMS